MTADAAGLTGPRFPLSGIALGCDYNPEQWPEQVWEQDVELMREAGVGFVTVGVFSWALLQPDPETFNFDWLDRILDLLHANGIAVDLATATASPPAWLARAHPETLIVDHAGNRLWPGSRQNFCPSSAVFRAAALTLVEALATRYAGHPALAMWHVSNEIGCHNAHCYCDISAAAFRRWLQRRYPDLAALNNAWGTAFWSQWYHDWEEILPPRQTTTWANPTQQLDFARFSSDELLATFTAERDVLRRLSPGVPVTTNFMVMPNVTRMDYWQWAGEQDLISQDHYLDGRLEPVQAQPAELAFCADLTRGLAGGGPWFLMEHSTSAVNWQPVNLAKAPGQLLRNSLSHVARGADAVGFFQWRASAAGGEKFHSALVPHAGTDTKVWREVVELGGVLARVSEAAGTRTQAETAILFDWQAGWALNQGSHPTSLVEYADHPVAIHRALWRLGITVDGVRPGADLSGYRLVVVPTLYLADDACVARLRDFVEAGGQLVITFCSGLVDENDHIRLGGYPGAFRELLGLRSEEIFPLPADCSVHLASRDLAQNGTWTGSLWTELTHLDGAEAIARYLDGPVAGHPAITRNAVGAGAAWYVGTALDDAALTALLNRVAVAAHVQPPVPAPPGVEVVRRSGSQGSYLFVLNHGITATTILTHGYDLVSQKETTGSLTVEPGGSAVVREAY
ncbi:MAG TPA: beta-galactosidase [Kineosporiaceae bacterium]|nr:beta-galactosidase [Kineosporiaceae bacterium]